MRIAPCLLLASSLLGPVGCGDDDLTGGPPSLSAPLEVVPFDTPLPDVRVQPANDSLDLARHDGRTFLAFRTSTSFFPADNTEIHVVSSEGDVRWQHEITFATGDDLRDPRFLEWNGALRLFFGRFETGASDPVALGTLVSTLVPEEGWSEPEPVLDAGFVVSRTYVDDGLPYLTAYGPSGDALAVHFLTSDDGLQWRAVRAEGPAVEVGGGSETEVLFGADGGLLAVTVNARGDELGHGSRICRAARIDAEWSCTGDVRRFDGARLFVQDGRVRMLAVRNVTATGAYDLGREDLPLEQRAQLYLDDYGQRPKRCALWSFGADGVPAHDADLPSRGDTCAPSLLRRDDRHVAVYYHSSPLDGPDVTLRVGQAGASRIHRVVISF